jgi:hypothetical protein
MSVESGLSIHKYRRTQLQGVQFFCVLGYWVIDSCIISFTNEQKEDIDFYC